MNTCLRSSSILVMAFFVACSGGGGGGGAGAAGGGAGAVQPFAIDDAASPAVAANVRGLLEPGDRFAYEPDVVQANVIYDTIWSVLSAPGTWVAPASNTEYQFFDDTDPVTAWGRAYRYFGQNTFAGPVQPFTAGMYTGSNGAVHAALTLQTWDDTHAELLIVVSSDVVVHAIQHTNGLPIVEVFERR